MGHPSGRARHGDVRAHQTGDRAAARVRAPVRRRGERHDRLQRRQRSPIGGGHPVARPPGRRRPHPDRSVPCQPPGAAWLRLSHEIRAWRDADPTVAVGMEGAPGHQAAGISTAAGGVAGRSGAGDGSYDDPASPFFGGYGDPVDTGTPAPAGDFWPGSAAARSWGRAGSRSSRCWPACEPAARSWSTATSSTPRTCRCGLPGGTGPARSARRSRPQGRQGRADRQDRAHLQAQLPRRHPTACSRGRDRRARDRTRWRP